MFDTLFLNLLLATSFIGLSGGGPLVTVKNGTYAGIYSASYHQDLFLGMPYAKPPTDSHRLRLPESLDTRWTGVRNATSFGNGCLQLAPLYSANGKTQNSVL